MTTDRIHATRARMQQHSRSRRMDSVGKKNKFPETSWGEKWL